MNRQTKRQMAKAGTDRPARPQERRAAAPTRERERTTPKEFFSEVRGEMRKVAWPTRPEVIRYSIIVTVCVVFYMIYVGLIDYGMAHFSDWFYG